MAQIDILAPFILSFEGGYVNDPDDAGGATNMGVTINTWKQYGRDIDGDGDIDVDDLRRISQEDAVAIMKKNYWDTIHADEIESQSVANLLVDWTWGSGAYNAVALTQKLLGVKADGKVGPQTLAAINSKDPAQLFQAIHDRRREYFNDIVQNRPQNQKFLNGWLRRLDSIQFESLKCNGGRTITFADVPAVVEPDVPNPPDTTDEPQQESFLAKLLKFLAGLFSKK